MCEPTTLAVASLAMAAAGTGLSVMGQMNQQAAMGAQQGYLAQVARQRQQVAEMQAKDAIDRGKVAEQKQREITGQRIGTQTAQLAAQGTDLAGSPTDILSDTRRAGEFDALTVRNNAAREAWGYQVQGTEAGADAQLRSSFQPSYIGTGASLLMGASSLSDKWSKFQWPGSGGSGTSGYSGTVAYSGGDYAGVI